MLMSANSMTVLSEGLDMPYRSHITNVYATANVRTCLADFGSRLSHNANMARRGKPKQINWYLREWMDTLIQPARGRQAKMAKLTGWSKATTSQLYNGDQDYSPKVVKQAADALGVAEYELLMPPERAMRMRQLLAQLKAIATDAPPDPPEPDNKVVRLRRPKDAKPDSKDAAETG